MLDKALQNLVIHKSEIVKLWENASIDAPFVPQTLAINLDNYEAVLIITQGDRTNITSHTFNIDSKSWNLAEVSNTVNSRPIQVTKTGIIFGSGEFFATYAGTTKASDRVLRPYVIYGIKKVNLK